MSRCVKYLKQFCTFCTIKYINNPQFESFIQTISFNGILYAFGGKVGTDVNENVFKLTSVEANWEQIEGVSVITDEGGFSSGFRVFFPAIKIEQDKLYCQ